MYGNYDYSMFVCFQNVFAKYLVFLNKVTIYQSMLPHKLGTPAGLLWCLDQTVLAGRRSLTGLYQCPPTTVLQAYTHINLSTEAEEIYWHVELFSMVFIDFYWSLNNTFPTALPESSNKGSNIYARYELSKSLLLA